MRRVSGLGVHPGHRVVTYQLLRNSLEDSRRLAFLHSMWHLVLGGGNLRGVPYVGFDFEEDMPSLLSLFPEFARSITVWPGLQLLTWNTPMTICLHPLGGDFVGLFL